MPELSTVAAFGSIQVVLGPGEFARLNTIMSLGLTVLASDAPGVDEQIQSHLHACGYRNVVVYHNGRGTRGGPRRNIGAWPTVRVDGSYQAKDERMCRDADAGLAFWNGQSRGTARNLAQFRGEGKPMRVVLVGAAV